MFGVLRFVFPCTPRSPHPWSSARMITTLGRSAAGAGPAARMAMRETMAGNETRCHVIWDQSGAITGPPRALVGFHEGSPWGCEGPEAHRKPDARSAQHP